MGTDPPEKVEVPQDVKPTLRTFICDALGIRYEPTPISDS
jgi:hypothetical protein